jgi:hypothetical protein
LAKNNKIIRGELKRGDLTSVVSFGCLHLGKEDKKFKNILYKYIQQTKPYGVISGGDLTDSGEFRHTARNGEGGRLTPAQLTRAMEKDYWYTREIIEKIQDYCSWLAFLRGNHDFRAEKIARENELFRESLSYETYKSEWAPEVRYHVKDYDLGQEFHLGHAKFIHGRYYGRNHLQQHYDTHGPNTYYWHTHEYAVKSFTKNTFTNAPQVATLGCGEKILPDWMNGAPHKWVNCFQQWYFEPNGTYQMYNIIVENGRAILPNGEILKG